MLRSGCRGFLAVLAMLLARVNAAVTHKRSRRVLGACAVLGLILASPESRVRAEPLHTYGNSHGQEIANVIAVEMSRLLPLVPVGYTIAPASSLGFGGPDQGVVAIANFRGFEPTVDGRTTTEQEQVAIDVAILVAEPPEAVAAGVNIPGAFHLYTLTIYTNDTRYAASLRGAGMPVKFVNDIGYQRDMDDATGFGTLTVDVPDPHSAFSTVNSALGYAPAPGAFNAVFWHDGPRGKAVLHFLDEPFRQGTAISQIYTRPGSFLAELLDGGGLGPCSPDPQTGYGCILAPSLNLRYDEGTEGTLQLIK